MNYYVGDTVELTAVWPPRQGVVIARGTIEQVEGVWVAPIPVYRVRDEKGEENFYKLDLTPFSVAELERLIVE